MTIDVNQTIQIDSNGLTLEGNGRTITGNYVRTLSETHILAATFGLTRTVQALAIHAQM